MRAFSYCRVSSEEQSTEDHYSLENQEKKAKEQSKLKDWQIVRVRKDVASGKDTNRPGYQELVAAIKGKEIDVVVVYRLDRLSRNVRDIYDFLALIKEHDVAFCSISEGFDTTTAMGRAMLGVAAVFAQLTREMIAENVRDGLLRRAESGKWNGPKWNPPYGYSYVVGGTIEPREDEVEIARQVFRWFTADKWGTTKIARVLNSQGVIKDSAKPGSGQWHQVKVWEMLQNPVYAGYLQAGDKLVKGDHEPLIDEQTWELAKEIAAGRKKTAPRTKASPHLLSGLVRCGTCNRALVAQFASYKRKDGERRFVGFRHAPNEYSGDRYCSGVYHRGDTLEESVVASILELSKKPGLMELALSSAQRRLADESQPIRDEATQIAGRLSELDRLFDNWADRLDRHVIDDKQFERHNAALLVEKEKLQTRLDELDRKLSDGEHIEVSLAEVQQVLQDVSAAWGSLQFEERREILKLLVEKVAVHPDKVELHLYHLPVQELETRRSGRLYERRNPPEKKSSKKAD
jgi:site-specific DNA recombinase